MYSVPSLRTFSKNEIDVGIYMNVHSPALDIDLSKQFEADVIIGLINIVLPLQKDCFSIICFNALHSLCYFVLFLDELLVYVLVPV